MGRLNKHTPRWAQAIIIVWMLGALAAALFYLPDAKGFIAGKIVIFHVPFAIVSVLAYIIATIFAVAYLAKNRPDLDAKSATAASLGLVFTALTMISGMIFAQIEWRSAWNWDPRETSILMLLILYAAYFALRGAIPNAAIRARISAVYSILACVMMPYLVFVMPRLSPGLHPSNAHLSPQYRLVMLAVLIGYLGVFVWIFQSAIAQKSKQ